MNSLLSILLIGLSQSQVFDKLTTTETEKLGEFLNIKSDYFKVFNFKNDYNANINNIDIPSKITVNKINGGFLTYTSDTNIDKNVFFKATIFAGDINFNTLNIAQASETINGLLKNNEYQVYEQNVLGAVELGETSQKDYKEYMYFGTNSNLFFKRIAGFNFPLKSAKNKKIAPTNPTQFNLPGGRYMILGQFFKIDNNQVKKLFNIVISSSIIKDGSNGEPFVIDDKRLKVFLDDYLKKEIDPAPYLNKQS